MLWVLIPSSSVFKNESTQPTLWLPKYILPPQINPALENQNHSAWVFSYKYIHMFFPITYMHNCIESTDCGLGKLYIIILVRYVTIQRISHIHCVKSVFVFFGKILKTRTLIGGGGTRYLGSQNMVWVDSFLKFARWKNLNSKHGKLSIVLQVQYIIFKHSPHPWIALGEKSTPPSIHLREGCRCYTQEPYLLSH